MTAGHYYTFLIFTYFINILRKRINGDTRIFSCKQFGVIGPGMPEAARRFPKPREYKSFTFIYIANNPTVLYVLPASLSLEQVVVEPVSSR